MANLVARLLENKISYLFENFQAGKNATSSLIKGEGVATNLIFNRTLINDMLPRSFVAESATCQQLKWQVSIISLGTAPIVIVLSGVDIKIVQLPAGQLRREPTGKRKTKRKVQTTKKENTKKKNAILSGAKVTVQGISIALQLQHSAPHPSPGAPLPSINVQILSVRVHSTNSQWQEVTDLTKVHVVNTATVTPHP